LGLEEAAMAELSVTVPALPTTVEEFLSLRNDLATTPQGGAAVYAAALCVYAGDPALGLQLLTIATDASELHDGTTYKNKGLGGVRERALKDRIGAKPYVARSYFQGTSPENGYTLPSGPLSVNIRHQDRDPIGEDTAKLFVHSTGADSPRPIHLKKNNRGLWKARNAGSLDVGIRKPVEAVDDDL
jgi:hypothetical protein